MAANKAGRLRVLLAVGALVSCVVAFDVGAGTTQTDGVSLVEAEGAPASDAPAKVGALFSNDLDGGHFCTASVVHSEGRNLIVTAAHCLGDGEGVVFAPGYHDGEAPYGTWKLDKVFQDATWTDDDQESEDADVAFATLAPKDGKEIEDVTGATTLDASGRTGDKVTVTGYPSSEDAPRTCTNTAGKHSGTQQRIDCPDFATGTSGSPWIAKDGKLVGILGGYQGGGDEDDVSYSIVLGKLTADLYKKATSS
ncbi:trypsin-like serine peptidase [Streptomyces sp. NBC_01304]|uniref:trypsin-like serine peptidase n=1 Tax=Streptomyces sp. NBC_01304 TaxID=2903818 RepID=UPI002E0E5652|nr:trypsin-like peptidase domain-containing protein [Streptomyces sp. NBC_01304]